jgi:hypothetical protein
MLNSQFHSVIFAAIDIGQSATSQLTKFFGIEHLYLTLFFPTPGFWLPDSSWFYFN